MHASSSQEATRQPPSSPLQHRKIEAESPVGARDRVTSSNDLSVGDLSEAETLGDSSPELPPLPAPPRYGFAPRTPQARSTPPSSEYYTASWGSPYDISLPPAGRHSDVGERPNISHAFSPDDIDEDSPQLAFGLSHLIPSRLSATFEVTPTRPSTPTGWSPTRETPRLSAASNQHALHLPPKNLLPFFSKVRSKLDLVLEDRSVENSQVSIGESSGQHKGHNSRFENRTLRQEDILSSTILPLQSDKMETSKYATPPKDKSGLVPSIEPSPIAVIQPKPPVMASIHSPPPLGQRTSSTMSLGNARTRRKLLYKGKTCWVALPNDPPRGGQGEAPLPYSRKELADHFKSIQDKGYDIGGFGNWDGSEQDYHSPLNSQNCPVYPETSDFVQDRTSSNYLVRIPNNKDWQAYVKELKEAKLRALGVSFGDEPEELPLSRQTSSQFPALPFSPPIPTSSAGSQRMSISGQGFPLGFIPGSSNHTSTRSIASPISSLGNGRHPSHMHRQSMFISPPILTQQALSPQGFSPWSPQGFPFQNLGLSAGSPGISSGATDMRSPISPFHGVPDGVSPFQFPQRAELVAQLQSQKQQQLNRQQLLAVRPASALPEVPEDQSEEETVPVQTRSVPPEMFNPRPGHRHNISAKLEETLNKTNFDLEKKGGIASKKVEGAGEPPNVQLERTKQVEAPPPSKAIPDWRKNAPAAIVASHRESIVPYQLFSLPTNNIYSIETNPKSSLRRRPLRKDDTHKSRNGSNFFGLLPFDLSPLL